MSEIAQSRDIQDPETARSFADAVQSPQRLALLMILTACDIRAVGPGVWTGWKGSLLRSLYYATEPLLSGGHSQVTQRDRIEAAKTVLRGALGAWPANEVETYVGRHYDHYWLRAEPELQVEHARMIRAADQGGLMFQGSIRVKIVRGHHRGLVLHPGPPAPALDHRRRLHHGRRLDHRRADLPGTRDGRAIDTFRLRRSFTSDEDEKVRATRIIDTVKQLLQGKRPDPHRPGQGKPPQQAPQAVQPAGAGVGVEQHFEQVHRHRGDGPRPRRPPAPAHPRHLDLNLTIGSAHIGTYGEKAVDVF